MLFCVYVTLPQVTLEDEDDRDDDDKQAKDKNLSLTAYTVKPRYNGSLGTY